MVKQAMKHLILYLIVLIIVVFGVESWVALLGNKYSAAAIYILIAALFGFLGLLYIIKSDM